MAHNNEEYISPHWAGFRSLWWIVAILLFLLLLIMWLLGYGPGGKACQVPVEIKTVEKLVTAPDLAAPLITLNDSSVLRLATGTNFVDPGARGTDGVDGNVTVTTEGNVDTSTPGEYMLTYKVTDAAGNSATETRKVIVSDAADTTAPVITLNDDSIVYLKTGDTYTEAGASATDVDDDNITVKTEGMVDTDTAGEYVITYTASDEAGNTTTETRKVIVVDPDKAAPIISLNDSSVIHMQVGDKYLEAGAKAVDATDGDLKITTEGTVDTGTAGEYTVTYSVTDSAGNTATKTRKIIVTAPVPAPVLVVEEPEPAAPAPIAVLYFGFDKDKNPTDKDTSLAAVIAYLKDNSKATAFISGYHDPRGRLDYNQDLAYRRAETVSSMMKAAGISADQIVLAKPVETTGTGEPAEARRVEVTIGF